MQTVENAMLGQTLSRGKTARNERNAAVDSGEQVAGHAMEAVNTLIDAFGNRLQHTLPRMRRWTMYKRPRNCVKIISHLEANICAGKVQVLEELKATNDEVRADYWVKVDFDMSVGP
ncbi:hypothetical protein LWI28_024282 [Acer negundo]|uniref:Uncharacterized protein n=1 Tax=Acer negundo TaxID=4023 RepID=A0AAD5P691_ACENE|nr:hypothetical protein LWI28_024282 [Acer negundo]